MAQLVPDDIWQAVQDRLDGYARVPRKSTERCLLTEFLFCPLCGARMRGQIGQRRYRCAGTDSVFDGTTCWQTADAPRLDGLMSNTIASVLRAATSADGATMSALRRAWRVEQSDTNKDAIAWQIKAQEHRIGVARANIDRATDLMLERRIPQDAYDRAVQRHQADADEAQDQLLKLRRELAVRPPKLPELDPVLSQLGGCAEVLKDSPIRSSSASSSAISSKG